MMDLIDAKSEEKLNVREARMKDLRITIDLRIMRGSHGVRVSVFMPRESYSLCREKATTWRWKSRIAPV